MNKMQKIMIADDDAEIREVIRILLEGEGYQVIEAANGNEAIEMMESSIVLIILDVMMPGCSGIIACNEIRKEHTVPILFLTAKSKEEDIVIGFSAGADDYLVKPFSYTELLSRVKALIRRYCIYMGQDTQSLGHIYLQDIEIDMDARRVTKSGKEITLTDLEYQILALLATHRKKIFSAQNIYESVWKEPYYSFSSNTVAVHIRNLRKKLEDDIQNPHYIQNIWGRGYRIV